MLKKILVPCDGSESSLRAVDYAGLLAQRFPEATVELLHVLDPSVFHEQDDACRAEAERVLAPARERLRSAGITPEWRCRVGAPAPQIADEVAEAACDAVVMGTRGMRPLANLVIGSVASGVVSFVDVPVTLIK